MQVYEFLQKIQPQLEEYRKNPSLSKEGLVVLEHLALILESLPIESQVNEISLSPLIEYLKNRWEIIKPYANNYINRPASDVTRICLSTALILSDVLKNSQLAVKKGEELDSDNLERKQNPYYYLMPDLDIDSLRHLENYYLKISEDHLKKSCDDSKQLQLEEGYHVIPHLNKKTADQLAAKVIGYFILADNSKSLIDVSESLRSYDLDHKKFYSSVGQKRELTKTEIERLVKRSDLSYAYYVKLTGSGIDDKFKKEFKEYFEKGLVDSDKKLSEINLEEYKTNINDLVPKKKAPTFATLTDLLSYLKSQPSKIWGESISQIPNGELYRLVLNGKTFEKAVAEIKIIGQDTHNKALFFCVLELYWRRREPQGEATSLTATGLNKAVDSLGSWFNTSVSTTFQGMGSKIKSAVYSMTDTYTLEQKKQAYQALLDQLQNPDLSLSDIALGLKKQRDNLRNSTDNKDNSKGALYAGDLGSISSKIIELHPEKKLVEDVKPPGYK